MPSSIGSQYGIRLGDGALHRLPCTFRQRCKGSQRYSVILSTRMQPIVRTASARISGLGSWESCDVTSEGSFSLSLEVIHITVKLPGVKARGSHNRGLDTNTAGCRGELTYSLERETCHHNPPGRGGAQRVDKRADSREVRSQGRF